GRGAAQRLQPTAVRYVDWLPPFGSSDIKVLYEGSGRLTSVAFSADGKTMFASDSGAVIAMRVADPSKKFNLGRGVTIPAAPGAFGGGRGGAFGSAGADTSAAGGALAMKPGANGP